MYLQQGHIMHRRAPHTTWRCDRSATVWPPSSIRLTNSNVLCDRNGASVVKLNPSSLQGLSKEKSKKKMQS